MKYEIPENAERITDIKGEIKHRIESYCRDNYYDCGEVECKDCLFDENRMTHEKEKQFLAWEEK